MKGSVKGSAFAEAMALVGGVVGRSGAMPLDTAVVLKMAVGAEFGAGTLTLRGTDREQHILATLPCVLHDPGEVGLNAERLTQIANELKGGEVSLDGDLNALTVRGAGGRFRLQGITGLEHYPEMPTALDESAATVVSDFLSLAIRNASFAAIKSDKPIGGFDLSSVLVTLDGPGDEAPMGAIYGTDRLRMVRVAMPLKTPAPVPQVILIPVRALRMISAVLRGTQIATVGVAENYMLLETPGIRLAVLLSGGNFPRPSLDQAIAQANGYPHAAVMNGSDLTAAVRRANIVAGSEVEGSEYRRLTLEFTKDALVVRALSADGEAEWPVPATGYEGEPLSMVINGPFLLDWLGLVIGGGSMVTIRLAAESHFIMLTSVGAPVYIVNRIRS